MLKNILGSAKSAEKPEDASDARSEGRGEGPDIDSPADGTPRQDQVDEALGRRGRSYLETLYPDDWSSRFECMGVLTVEREADPSDVVKVCQTLNEGLKANILYVNPTVRGMSIVCGIKDLGSFIDSLPNMPGLASWSLTHC